MKTDDQIDIPGTRKSIEKIATKFNIYFLFLMAMGGGVIFITGLVMTRAEFLKGLPEPGVAIAIGMFAFCLFFPWFIALYYARHLLISVKKVETALEKLKGN